MYSRTCAGVAALLTLVMASPAASQDDVLYGLYGDAYFGSLLLVSRDTGATLEIGETGVSEPLGMDCAPDGTLWGGLGFMGAGQIVTFDPTTGAATVVGPSGFLEVRALAVAPGGVIYVSVSTGTGDTADGLATVDPATGAATLVGGLYGPGVTGMVGLAVSPAGVLYGVSNESLGSPALYSIDTVTGAATLVGLIEDGPGNPLDAEMFDIAFASDGTLYASTASSSGYFSAFAGVGGSDLWTIDPATALVTAFVGTGDHIANALGFCRAASTTGVFAILPERAGDEGSVDAVIFHGLTLPAGAEVVLRRTGEPDIVGAPVLVEPALHRITTTFDLTGSALGPWDVVVTDATDPGNVGVLPDGFTVEDASLSIVDIVPETGGNDGSVTAVLRAWYVDADATVKLVRGGEEIVASPVEVAFGNPLFAEPATLTATFDLRDRAVGGWDVVVTNPSAPGSPAVVPGGFVIAAGVPPEVSLSLAGPALIRIGRPTLYRLTMRNEGNVDATAVLIVYGVPEEFVWRVSVPPAPFGGITPNAQRTETTEGPAIVLPSIALSPGVERRATLEVEAPAETDFQIRAVLVQGP